MRILKLTASILLVHLGLATAVFAVVFSIGFFRAPLPASSIFRFIPTILFLIALVVGCGFAAGKLWRAARPRAELRRLSWQEVRAILLVSYGKNSALHQLMEGHALERTLATLILECAYNQERPDQIIAKVVGPQGHASRVTAAIAEACELYRPPPPRPKPRYVMVPTPPHIDPQTDDVIP